MSLIMFAVSLGCCADQGADSAAGGQAVISPLSEKVFDGVATANNRNDHGLS